MSTDSEYSPRPASVGKLWIQRSDAFLNPAVGAHCDAIALSLHVDPRHDAEYDPNDPLGNFDAKEMSAAEILSTLAGCF